MAVVGALGDVVFSVSRNQIRTFDELKWDSGAKYAFHARHLQTPLAEFTGLDTDTLSFSMSFSLPLGIIPLKELEKLSTALKAGKAMRLILGTDVYGTRWIITKLSRTLSRFDNHGNLIAAKASVSLSAYT